MQSGEIRSILHARFSSLVLTRRPKIFKKRPQTLKNPLTPIGSCRDLHIFEHVYNTSGHIYENLTKIPKSNISNVLVNSTKQRWSGRASSLFSLFEKCVPLARNHTFLQKNTESRTHGYVNNSRNLPTSRTQRTQGRNNSVQGNPSLRHK